MTTPKPPQRDRKKYHGPFTGNAAARSAALTLAVRLRSGTETTLADVIDEARIMQTWIEAHNQ